ncbi:hypothetical protein BDS110ZK4_30290 [Bradyrhizobium diazoefficiens]|uniref:Integrase catalytic domain-containing protein n=1 Tax=Bradyrhizobium diazoefficiens TaxID=1355477 RepID=A0A810CTB7_9BRAD|nr:hypothetical protein XF4B_44980 [Bradyrhizobium diazoefficiens]BCE91665.1 hypothetical protein XF10B_44630 [Bradyrhizobium diazoefficiens]
MRPVRHVPHPIADAYAQPERMIFGKTDRIVLSDDIDWVCVETDDFGHVLRAHHDKKTKRFIKHSEMKAEASRIGFRHDPGWYSVKAQKTRARNGVASLSDLKWPERQIIMWKEGLITEFEILKQEDPDHTTKGSKFIKTAIAKAHARVAANAFKVGDGGKRKYFGRLKTFPDMPPGPKAFLTSMKLYYEADRDALALRSGKYRSGNFTERMTGEQLELIDEYARQFLAPNEPSANGLWESMKAHIENVLNPQRKKKKLPPIKVPSRGRFYDAVDDFDLFEKVYARKGPGRAQKKFTPSGDGVPDLVRALQEVEIDHWTVNLRTILEKARIWHRLNRPSRRKLEKVRMTLGVAVCRTTRCILGMVLTRTASVEAAVRLIEMVVSNNKSRFGEAAGCLTPYDILGKPELILFDGGPAFNNGEVRAVLRDLDIDWEIGPGGLAHLRGRVERLFGIIDDECISWFEGRTFSDIAAKGDYDPDARTGTSVEELGRVLVRYVIDRHHNRPRKFLGGDTPREHHIRLTRGVGVHPTPDPDKMRNVFGFTLKRTLTASGIRFLNVQYRSKTLHKLFMQKGNKQYAIRAYFPNIGAISVQVGNRLLTVPGPPEFDGVSAERWIAAEEKIRAKMKRTVRIVTGPVINAALLDARLMAEEARRRAGIDDNPTPRSVVLRAEARMMVFANFAEDRLDEPESNQDVYATAIPVGRAGDVDPDDLPSSNPRRAATKSPAARKRARRASKPTKTAAAAREPAAAPKQTGAKPPRAEPAKPKPSTSKYVNAKSAKPAARAKSAPKRAVRRPGLRRNFSARD